ncbi:MAG: D-alanine--D-alanine ligase, partial [Bacteroidaceae bacterium]|nr:D-alanine--D-alanine ligase [Bacteroidaceae bacterium]
MKKIIAIIAGGDSSEHDVSLRSAAGINSWLDRDKFIVYTVEISSKAWEAHLADGSKSPVNRHDFSFMDNGEKITPDYAYITIHGTPGEDGILQGYFDLLHIPYSTSNVLVEAMTFNKFALNQYLKSFGIRVADSMLIREGQKVSDEDVISHIGLPCWFCQRQVVGIGWSLLGVAMLSYVAYCMLNILLHVIAHQSDRM